MVAKVFVNLARFYLYLGGNDLTTLDAFQRDCKECQTVRCRFLSILGVAVREGITVAALAELSSHPIGALQQF